MRTRTQLTTVAALLAFGIAGTTTASAKSDLLSGDYAGKGNGVKTTISVDGDGNGKARYSLKTSCGTVKGAVALEAAPGGLKGKRVASAGTTTFKVNDEGEGDVTGSVKYVGVDSDDDVCKGKRSFTGSLDADSSDELKEMLGHYAGQGDEGGRPISFDVAYDRAEGTLEVRSLSFESDTECWMDLDQNGEDDTLVAKIGGLSGEVDTDGSFEIDVTPDDDTEYYVEGAIEDGEAELYVEVGGFFDLEGNPQAGGPLECDSWGEDYFAVKNG